MLYPLCMLYQKKKTWVYVRENPNKSSNLLLKEISHIVLCIAGYEDTHINYKFQHPKLQIP